MKIAGIIAEYNPFHNGHALHIEKTRAKNGGCEATHVVAVMSGNFTQRGEMAVLSKHERAAMALAGGADLVIELPLSYALSSAEGFAFGAVSLLNGMGCVDTISFGSECGDVALLQRVAQTMEQDADYSVKLRYFMTQGISYAQAAQKALGETLGNSYAKLLDSPNNVLGIEYLRAMLRIGSDMNAFTVPRIGPAHDAPVPVGNLSSASYLRHILRQGRAQNVYAYIPAACIAVLEEAVRQGVAPTDVALLDRAVLAHLRRMTAEQFAQLPGISEGLEHRLLAAVRQAASVEEVIEAVKTKRYPQTRIQRLIWNAFLGVPCGWDKQTPPYLHILAANEKGREILTAAKHGSIPQITRTGKVERLGEQAQQWFDLESTADDLYALAMPKPIPCGQLYTCPRIGE